MWYYNLWKQFSGDPNTYQGMLLAYIDIWINLILMYIDIRNGEISSLKTGVVMEEERISKITTKRMFVWRCRIFMGIWKGWKSRINSL